MSPEAAQNGPCGPPDRYREAPSVRARSAHIVRSRPVRPVAAISGTSIITSADRERMSVPPVSPLRSMRLTTPQTVITSWRCRPESSVCPPNGDPDALDEFVEAVTAVFGGDLHE